MANKTNSSVRFLGESTARQSTFRFYLTFSGQKIQKHDISLKNPLHSVKKTFFQNSITYITLTSMGAELQSQNHVDVDYGKTTGLIYLKF
jgi:hypothetical protein